MGEEALDRLAIAMGGKAMVPVLFERIRQLIKSSEWKHRHAALMAISQVCDRRLRRRLVAKHMGQAETGRQACVAARTPGDMWWVDML